MVFIAFLWLLPVCITKYTYLLVGEFFCCCCHQFPIAAHRVAPECVVCELNGQCNESTIDSRTLFSLIQNENPNKAKILYLYVFMYTSFFFSKCNYESHKKVSHRFADLHECYLSITNICWYKITDSVLWQHFM